MVKRSAIDERTSSARDGRESRSHPATDHLPGRRPIMTTIRITGWREGLNKVELNHLLRRHAGCGLGEAKRAVDQLLAGEPLAYEFADGESASAFRRLASAVGAVCSDSSDNGMPSAENGDATTSSSPAPARRVPPAS
jgi:hypothetical protein